MKKKTKAEPKELKVVPVEEGKEYESEGRKLTLVEQPFLSEKQILKIFQRTPANHIYRRPGKGGGQFEYVTGAYIKKVLNYVFGWNWSFKIVEHGTESGQVWVLGELTVAGPDGRNVTKMQFGRAEVKTMKGSTATVDFGNDLKAAATDALKKCASEFGIASDVYAKNEFKEVGILKEKPVKSAEAVVEVEQMVPGPEFECTGCGEAISRPEFEYYQKMQKPALCRRCAKEQKQNAGGDSKQAI